MGHKISSGDGRTPEGQYWIDRRNPRSEFFLSLGVSYPNATDVARARARGVRPGGDIFVHGERGADEGPEEQGLDRRLHRRGATPRSRKSVDRPRSACRSSSSPDAQRRASQPSIDSRPGPQAMMASAIAAQVMCTGQPSGTVSSTTSVITSSPSPASRVARPSTRRTGSTISAVPEAKAKTAGPESRRGRRGGAA